MSAKRRFPCLGCLALGLLFVAAITAGAAVLAARAPGVTVFPDPNLWGCVQVVEGELPDGHSYKTIR